MSHTNGSTEQEHTCKIDDTIAEFDLTALNERLVSRWRGDNTERLGVRKLADYYNRQVLRAVLRRAGDQVRADQADYIYRVLTADPAAGDTEITVSQQEQWRSTLSNAGVEFDTVKTKYWVSYTTVYTHLTQCLNESSPDTSSSRTVSDEMDVMRRLATKSEKIAAAGVKRQVAGESGIEDRFEFDADVQIRCSQCGYKDTLVKFLSEDGCYCDDVTVVSADSVDSDLEVADMSDSEEQQRGGDNSDTRKDINIEPSPDSQRGTFMTNSRL